MNAFRTVAARLALALVISAGAAVSAQTPIGTAFTYQGELQQAGILVDGPADLSFSLWDASSGGVRRGSPITLTNVAVSNGTFAVRLDFGESAFNGDSLWLEIQVRAPAGSGAYATLTPRQEMLASPNALYARTANSASNADMIDTIHASAVPAANKLLPLDASGKFPNSALRTGSGGGLDADLLDGQHGAFYRDASNLSAGLLADARLSANVALLAGGQTFSGTKVFSSAPSFAAAGSPFTVTSSVLVGNLNADLLDGLDSVFFRDASNLNAGTLSDSRLSPNVAMLGGTQTFSGAKTFSTTPGFTAAGSPFTVTSSTLVANLNADLLDGQQGSFYQDASNLNAGTVGDGRISGAYSLAVSFTSASNSFAGSGAGLTGLNAGGISAGTLSDARLSSNVALLTGSQTFSGYKTFSAAPSFTAAGAPFSVGSTTLVTNLNADYLDGQHAAYYQNASNINAGTLADARHSTNVALLNTAQTFTANKYFSASVGIGTVSPSYALDVQSAGTGAVYGYATAASGINYGVYGRTASASGWGGYFQGRGYFSDHVGIGAAPDNSEGWNRLVEIVGADHARLSLRTTNAPQQIDGRVMVHASGIWGSPPGMILGTKGAQSLTLGTNSASRISMTSAGRVGIGTVSPSYPVHITGSWDGSGGVLASFNTASGFDVPGVYGQCTATDYYGYGVEGAGGYRGVYGHVAPTGSDNYYGTYGSVNGGSGSNRGAYGYAYGTGTKYGGLMEAGGSGTNYGVNGSATGGTTNYGVYGYAYGGTAYAGYFSGNVNVTGTLSKGGGSFKIDHPLDPENKYLYHSFVESPDMKNIYDGNTTTDGQGFATIIMPDWFDALNRDFRYQLTVIDSGENDFVLARIYRKMEGNSFVIKTSVPNVEVSWQVTGIRQDAFANANRIPVEADKLGAEKGKLLHPEAFGRRAADGVDRLHAPVEDRKASSHRETEPDR